MTRADTTRWGDNPMRWLAGLLLVLVFAVLLFAVVILQPPAPPLNH